MQRILPKQHFSALLSNSTVMFSFLQTLLIFARALFPVNHSESKRGALQW